MKIIFLDIDGVLNSYSDHKDLPRYSYWKKPAARKEKPDSLMWYQYEIGPPYVELLNKIVEATGAKVVISSSWRIKFKHTEIAKLLKHRGFKGEVIDQTPMKLSYVDRGTEIRWWLDGAIEDGKDIEGFVILDDIGFYGFIHEPPEGRIDLRPHFVKTEDQDGLKDHNVDEAIDILMNKELEIGVV